MSTRCWILVAAAICVARPVLAGFNEGDSFGPSGLEMLAIGSVGLIGLPVGALVTFAGLEGLFRAALWLCAGLLAVLCVAGVLLAGELALILVLFAAMLAVPAMISFFVGGLLGRALRQRRAGAEQP
ncbi:hypothetical protein [Tateyamaria sp. SN6-1]|uniref:hypothetical protein n=1 Tax=Tateyamaria sp. SN6-1 TaxID=3092148 RepID=UPI0039F4A5D6